jgi:uncharacterized membrane protein
VIACAALYALWFAFWCTWRLASFQLGMDWGVISNAVVWASRGTLFRSALRGLETYSFWQEHFSPILLIFVPPFWAGGTFGLLCMLLSQALADAAAGWLLFRIGRIWLRDDLAALAAALLWFSNGRVQMAILHDFHKFTISPFFLLLAFWGAAAGRRRWMWAGFAGTLLLREDAFLALLGLPLFLFFLERRRREALLMVGIIALYEAAVFKAVFPALGRSYRFFGYYEWIAPGPGALLRRLLTEPHAVLRLLLTQRDNGPLVRFLSLFGFLPLLSPGGWLTGLSAMSESLLSNATNLTSYFYHYVVPAAAMLTLGTLLTLRSWCARLGWSARARGGAAALLGALALYNLQQDVERGAVPGSAYLRLPRVAVTGAQLRRVRSAERLAARIPAGERAELGYTLFTRWQARPGVWPYKGREAIDPRTRWLLVDGRARTRLEREESPLELVRSGEWHVAAVDGAVTLLARGAGAGAGPVLLRWYDPLQVRTDVGARTDAERLAGKPGVPGRLVAGASDDLPPGRIRVTLFLEAAGAAGEAGEVALLPAGPGGIAALRRPLAASELGPGGQVELDLAVPAPGAAVALEITQRGPGSLSFLGGRLDWLGPLPGAAGGGR